MKKLILPLLAASLLSAETIVLKPIKVTGFSEQSEYEALPPKSKELIESKVVIQETAPGLKNPVINGLQGDKVLLTIDGIKFTNSLFRDGPNQYYSWIPDEFIKEYELNSALSGITSNAIGGSIDRTIGVDKSKIGGSYNTSNKGHKEVVKYKDKSYEAAALNHKTSDVITPNGEVQHSSYNQKGFMFVHKNKDYGTSKLVFTKSNDLDRTDKFEKGQYYVYELQQYLLLSHKYNFKDYDLAIIPSFQQFREKINRHSPTKKDIDSTDNMFGLQAVGYVDSPFSNDDYISYGIVDNYEDIDYTKGHTNTPYKYNVLSVWGTYNGEAKSIDYELLYKFSNMNASGSGLNRNLSNNAFGIHTKKHLGFLEYVYLNGDMNYKFPTIDNLATATDGSTDNLPNKNLKQEKAYTLELGYRYDWLQASVFYKNLYDMIIKTETNIPDGNGGNKWQYNNTNKGHIAGINLTVNKKWKNCYSLFASAEYLDAKTDYGYISKLTPLHTTLIAGYKPYYIDWKYAPKVPDDKMAKKDKTDIRIKGHNYGYSIVNLGYKKVFNKVHDVKVEITNIFNSTGRVYGSSVDFGERGIFLSYKYNY